MYDSTCFGRPYAHHQELIWDPTGYLLNINWPDHDQQHCYHHAPMVKPEAATAAVELLMMGMRTPKTC